jgi:hypothetical protein
MTIPIVHNIQHGNRQGRGAKVTCGSPGCLRSIEIPINRFVSGASKDLDRLEQRQVIKRLHDLGWLVGKRDKDHRCPNCILRLRAAHIKSQENVVPIRHDPPPKPTAIIPKPSTVVPISSQTPRQQSKEDGRIIFEKLNEVYVQDGYSGDWTDAKVATDLGCPRAWIAEIRERFFGPIKSNETMMVTLAEAKTILARIKVLDEQFAKLLGEIAELLSKGEYIEKKILQIEKDLAG